MRRHILLTGLCLFVGVHVAMAQLTPEQALDRRTVGELRFSPDGSRLAMTVTDPPDAQGRNRDLWVLDVATRKARPFTTSEKSDRLARWSPDGQTLAFLSDRRERPQIHLLNLAGGEPIALTDLKSPVQTLEWAPDGRTIAFLAAPPSTPEREQLEKARDDEKVADRDVPRSQLWTVDVQTHAVHQVTSGAIQISEIVWLKDGTRVVAIANDRPGSDQFTDRFARIEVPSGTISWIGSPRGPIERLRLSPDGQLISFLGSRVDGPVPHDLYVQPIDGRPATNLTGSRIDRPVTSYAWRSDGSLLAGVEDGFRARLFVVRLDGDVERLADLDVMPSNLDVSTKGIVAFVGETTTEAPEVYLREADGSVARASTLNARWQSSAVAAPEFIKYRSQDGVEIEAMVLRPKPIATALPPLVVLVHGGPTGRWSDSFQSWGQLLAARGYVVLYPNIRGSSGYGHRFLEMNRGDWGGGDFKDVMAGVNHLVKTGTVDGDRVGIGGWSYGGYMAAWAVTQTTRFRAAVAGAGMSDLATEFGTEESSAYDEWFYGLPYERPQGFTRSSPLTYVTRVRTPTLLLHGENDPVDPLGQSQAFYRALKRYGVQSDLVVYPREPHGFQERAHILDMLGRMTTWFDEHLGPGRTQSAHSVNH